MSLTGMSLLGIGEKKIFHELDVHSCLKSRIQTYLV